MKSPIRSSKTAAPVTAANNPPRMALANVAYSGSKKKTGQDISLEKPFFPKSAGKKK